MHRVLDGSQHTDTASALPAEYPAQADYDMGGSDFGIADGASWDDASSRGDDWS